MRVFVTGIAGLIGSHVADACLARGDTVAGNDSLICGDINNVPHGVSRFVQLECQANPVAMWRKNLWQEMKEFKPDVVVHAAATASEGFSVFSPHFITKNIAEASVATFSAAIAAGAKRIVHMSSMARYGNGFEEILHEFNSEWKSAPFIEWYATNPLDPYGHAKVYSENVLKSLCQEHGVNWTIAVPHNVIGPRQEISAYRNVASIFLNRLKLDMPVYIYGDGEQTRCFSPIDDCISCIMKMVDGVADGEVVNIGPDGGEITINELLAMCEEITGKKAERVYLPPRPITDTVKNAYCSSDKARKLLGYQAIKPLRECLQEMSDAMVPREFKYDFPLEIENDRTPVTWKEKLQ